MVYPPKNEILDLTGLTLKVDDVLLTGGGAMSFSTFRPDTTGTNDVTDRLVEALTEASTQKRPLVIPYGETGVYKIDKEHVLLSGLSNLTVICEPGVVFNDVGRILRKANDSGDFRLPWGIEFVDCTDIYWEGGIFKSNGSSLGGSSSGTFDATNYELRKPVLGFVNCDRVKIKRIGHQGSPGQGMDTAAVASTNPVTPSDYAYASLRAAFFNAYQCTEFVREDCYLVPDTCSREQVTFCDSDMVEWHRERSVSTGNNFASLGKIIGCRKVIHGGHYVVDTGTGSLIDQIGDDIEYYGAILVYPNGKGWDTSKEWGEANQSSRNVNVHHVITTGRGPTNVGADADVTISDYRVSDCRYEIGATDFSVDYAPIFQSCKDVVTTNDVFLNSFPFGRSWNDDGGTGFVAAVNTRFEWTKPSGSLAQARRQSISRDIIYYYDVDWLQNTSLAGASNGLASFTMGKDADATSAEHIFYGGTIRDATWTVNADTTVRLYGVQLIDFSWSGSGTLVAYNCTLNGLPYNTVPTEYADDAAAASGGVPVGGTYRTGSALKIRVS